MCIIAISELRQWKDNEISYVETSGSNINDFNLSIEEPYLSRVKYDLFKNKIYF